MTQSIARYLIGTIFAFLVGKGIITPTQAGTIEPNLIQALAIVLGGASLVLWSYLEKRAKGVLPFYTGSSSTGAFASVRMLLLLSACAATLALVACAGPGQTSVTTPTGSVPVSTSLINTGYEIENFLQEFNTGTSAVVPGVDQFLDETHNSKDAATVALYSTLASGVASIAEAALKAGLPPQQVQTAVNAQLAPAVAETAAANVTVTQAPSVAQVVQASGQNGNESLAAPATSATTNAP